MTIKLFTIGDSISQGYMSGAAACTDCAYSTLIAKQFDKANLFNFTAYRYPDWPAGGMPAPFNIEPVLRELTRKYGSDISGLEWLTVLQTVNSVLQEAEEYYERGDGRPSNYVSLNGDTPEYFHNIAVQGFDVADAWTVTPDLCEQEIGIPQNTIKDDWRGGPNAPFYRTALRVLNPQGEDDYSEFSALKWLEHLAETEGIENLVLWLGGNNALGTVIDLEIRMTPNNPNKRPRDYSHLERRLRNWNLWHPDDFEDEYGILLSEVDRIMAKNKADNWKVFIATIPAVTIAPFAKGVGSEFKVQTDWGYTDANGKLVKDVREKTYFKYYTYFPFEASYAEQGGKHLPLQHAVFIDRCILAYNRFIKEQVYQRHQKNGRYFIVDIADALDRIAFKRNNGNIEYKLPSYFDFIFPPVNTKYYHVNVDGKLKQGGLFSLDGVHPSAIGQGLIAYEFLNVMKDEAQLGVDTDLDWYAIFESDSLYTKPISLMHELYDHDALLKLLINASGRWLSKK